MILSFEFKQRLNTKITIYGLNENLNGKLNF